MPERERRRIVDGLAAGLTPARRSRRDQVAFAPLRLARQSVLGSEVQDAHVSPGFPHALWLARRCPRALRRLLSLVQHGASPQRARAAHPFAVHHELADVPNAVRPDVLTAAYAARPERFVPGLPTPGALPTAAWINPPKPRTSEDVAQ